MRRSVFLALVASLATVGAFAGPAVAQVETVSAGAERTAVVIYRDRVVDTSRLLEESQEDGNELDRQGLALIVETRTIDLPAGEAVIRLKGVATGIIPQTATLDGLPATVVERNTDFDLLSPGSLLEKSIGETVRLVRTNPETGVEVEKTAIVRSGPRGAVLEIDGRLEALQCSGGPERIIFDHVPDGLSDQPILSVRTRAPTAGRYTVTLAYLATGLQWSADYVARVRPDGRTLDLDGWITLANFGGTSFADAPVQVVAGNLNRDEDSVPVDPVAVDRRNACWPMDTTTGQPMADEVIITGTRLPRVMRRGSMDGLIADESVEEVVVTGSRIVRMDTLGDYKIYTLPEPTDVRARQTKQIRFIQREGVAFERIYQARIGPWDDEEAPQPLDLVVRMRNETRGGLGLPLPGGGVSLIQRQGGHAMFTGQAKFEDRAVGLPVELTFGDSMGLTVESSFEDETRYDRHGQKKTVIRGVSTVLNDKAEAVEVELVPQQYGETGFRLLSSSVGSRIGDAGYPVWRMRVPAGQAVRLTYAYEYDD